MGLELAKKQVGEHLYEFEQFGAKKSVKLLIRLSKICGPAFVEGVSKVSGKTQADKKSLLEMDLSEFKSAITALMDRLDEDEILDIIEQFTANEKVLCDGKKIIFDTHYQQRLDHLFKVFWAALEVQYGNFFAALTALQSSAPRPMVTNQA